MATLGKHLWAVIGILSLDAPGGRTAFTPRKRGDKSGVEDPIAVS